MRSIDISFRGANILFTADVGSRLCKSGISDLNNVVSELFDDFCTANG